MKTIITTTLLLAGMAGVAGMAGMVVLAGAVVPAAAQAPGGLTDTGPAMNLFDEGRHLRTDVEVKQEQDRERAYKSGISKIPDKKVKNDPWGAVRTTPPTASATK